MIGVPKEWRKEVLFGYLPEGSIFTVVEKDYPYGGPGEIFIKLNFDVHGYDVWSHEHREQSMDSLTRCRLVSF